MTHDTALSKTSHIIQTLAKQGLLTDTHQVEITKLTGGYHNYVYRLRNNNGIDWVIKQYVTQSNVPLFPVLPDHESGALKALEETGITPKYIDFLSTTESGEILIYEFVEGEQWQKDTASVARMLSKVHQAKNDQPFRQLPNKPDELTQQTQAILDQMHDNTEASELLDQYMIPSDWSGTVKRCLIHTDCGPGNIIVGNQGPVLIDWQCPGLGDPIEDLINFSSPSIQILYGLDPLSDDQLSTFFEAYSNSDAMLRIAEIGNYYRARFLAYCFYREESLRIIQPNVSTLYRKALTADLNLMNA
ncbi:MAG: thiamine kinase [Gammaproteobacteria bacterium]|jgi:thiamine kinase